MKHDLIIPFVTNGCPDLKGFIHRVLSVRDIRPKKILLHMLPSLEKKKKKKEIRRGRRSDFFSMENSIKGKAKPYMYCNVTKRCGEIFYNICKPKMATINKRSELTDMCRHASKFKLKDYTSTA